MANLVSWLNARRKAVVALAGVVLYCLQSYAQAHPNHALAVAIGVLTVLGVHQISNVQEFDGVLTNGA